MVGNPVNNTPDLSQSRYEKLANDWRAVNQIIWQIPTAATAITAGIIIAAYQEYITGLPRIFILIIGSLLLFSLTIESVKKRLTMDAIRLMINAIEENAIEEKPKIGDSTKDKFAYSTFSDQGAYDYIKAKEPNYPGNTDYVLSLFEKSHARQALTHVIFYAGIAVSTLAILEIIAQIIHSKIEGVNTLWISGLVVIAISFGLEIFIPIINKLNGIQKKNKSKEY